MAARLADLCGIHFGVEERWNGRAPLVPVELGNRGQPIFTQGAQPDVLNALPLLEI